MFEFIYRKIRQRALLQFLQELYRYNEQDHCYDPIGSISRIAMMETIDQISRNKKAPRTKIAKAKQRQILTTLKGG